MEPIGALLVVIFIGTIAAILFKWLKQKPSEKENKIGIFLFTIERITKRGINVNFMWERNEKKSDFIIEMSTFIIDSKGAKSYEHNTFRYDNFTQITEQDLLLQAETLVMGVIANNGQ